MRVTVSSGPEVSEPDLPDQKTREAEQALTSEEPTSLGERDSRRVVASYGSRAEAQRVVGYLYEEKFPVERVSIVEDPQFVEQVAEEGYGKAALRGAGFGAVVGVFFAFFSSLLGLGVFNVAMLIVAPIVGAMVGAIRGLISHAVSGGRQQVTRRRGYGRVAFRGAGFGAVVGVFVVFFSGLLFGRVSSIIIGGLFIGAIVGATISLISHALSGRRRDFSSGETRAGRYNVVADEEVAEEASRLLAGLR